MEAATVALISKGSQMPRPPAAVKGVYQRDDDASGNWYARFRIDGKLVKKSFGSDRAAESSTSRRLER